MSEQTEDFKICLGHLLIIKRTAKAAVEKAVLNRPGRWKEYFMTERKIRLTKDSAFQFVKDAETCPGDVDLCYDRIVIDAKSLLGVLSLDFSHELTVKYCYNESFSKKLEAYA